MGALTILELAEAFTGKRATVIPTALVASTDSGLIQLKEVMNSVGRDLVARQSNQFIKRRLVWNSLGVEDQGTILSLFGEQPANIVIETLYNNTTRLPIYGPLSDREYQEILALVPSGPFLQYKIYNGHLYVTGGIEAGQELTVFYKSRAWLETAAGAGTFVAVCTADTNVPVFPDDLFLLGMEWMWRREKEMNYTAQLAEYTQKLLDSMGEPKPILKGHSTMKAPIPQPGIIVPAGNWTV